MNSVHHLIRPFSSHDRSFLPHVSALLTRHLRRLQVLGCQHLICSRHLRRRNLLLAQHMRMRMRAFLWPTKRLLHYILEFLRRGLVESRRVVRRD